MVLYPSIPDSFINQFASIAQALFATPNFPEYTSGHAIVAGAFTEKMTGLFGEHYHFTNHSYDYLGMAPRLFNSFDALAKEIDDSGDVCWHPLSHFLRKGPAAREKGSGRILSED